MKRKVFASLILAAIGAASLSAHHNMRAAFDFNKRFTHTGTLTKLEWTNPHIHLFVDVQNDRGQVETWSFEGPAPNRSQLRRAAFQDSVNKPVTVDASPARNGARAGLIREIRLANGDVVGMCPQNC
jgi:WD40 repeat protein